MCLLASASRPVTSSQFSTPRPSLPADFSKFEALADKLNNGEQVDQEEVIKTMFGMVLGVAKSIGSVDQVKNDVKLNSERITVLENKHADLDDIPLALGILILNLDLSPAGVSELNYARAVIKEVKAEGVNPDTDVVKAVRLGYRAASSNHTNSNDEKLGRVEIQLSSCEVRTKIMKSKKILENHSNNTLKKLCIHNKKTQA